MMSSYIDFFTFFSIFESKMRIGCIRLLFELVDEFNLVKAKICPDKRFLLIKSAQFPLPKIDFLLIDSDVLSLQNILQIF